MATSLETKEPDLLTLLKEVIDGLGTLLTGHLRLARAELSDDARRYARRGALLGVAAALLLAGYALCCVGVALALGPVLGPALSFVAVGGVHVLGASAGLAALLRRPPPRALDESLSALDRTVTTLSLTTDGRRATRGFPDREPEALLNETSDAVSERAVTHVLP